MLIVLKNMVSSKNPLLDSIGRGLRDSLPEPERIPEHLAVLVGRLEKLRREESSRAVGPLTDQGQLN